MEIRVMRILTIALVGTALAAPAAAQTARYDIMPFKAAGKSTRCAPGADVAAGRKQRPPSMKLGDQPPASAFYTVYNLVGGCPKPVVLRKGIGANSENAVPALRTPPRTTEASTR